MTGPPPPHPRNITWATLYLISGARPAVSQTPGEGSISMYYSDVFLSSGDDLKNI